MAMGQMISPGVYTRIIDLSEYLQDVPGTIGFLPFLSRKGEDNHLNFIASNEQFRNQYGDPNILDYGKAFGQGMYVAYNHLTVSSNLYCLRPLPDDAIYSHLYLGLQQVITNYSETVSSSSLPTPMTSLNLCPLYFDGLWHVTGKGYDLGYSLPPSGIPDDTKYDIYGHIDPTGETASERGFCVEYPTMNSVYELDTIFSDYSEDNTSETYAPTTDLMYPALTGGTGVPDGILCYFRGLGRGDFYNNYAIRLTRMVNNELFGVYTLDIYETQKDGDDMIIESFIISWDQNKVDDSGESMFIEDVVNKFSKNVRCKVNPRALIVMKSYMMDYYKNDPTLPSDVAPEYEVLDEHGIKTDLGFKATMILLAQDDYTYAQFQLNEALDVLSAARQLPSSSEAEIRVRNEAIVAAINTLACAREYYNLAKRNLNNTMLMDMFELSDQNTETAIKDPYHLLEGSEGSLVEIDKTTGKRQIQYDIAKQTLYEAYTGLLSKCDVAVREGYTYKQLFVDEVLDLDTMYFTLVYEAGYPADVKAAALNLTSKLRMDCFLISDCLDNQDLDDVIAYVGGDPLSSGEGYIWNDKYAARYNPYSKIYDSFTGRDLWITPVYHIAQLMPLNDRMYELWYATAGFNRGLVENIKELRWSPKQGERDQLYLMQVNPIVKFTNGYTIWGNLTTQKKPSSLQDVNVMRLVLYIKRALEQYCKYYIFEFNDSITHERIKGGIIPFLDRIKKGRGLVSFSVEVGATEWEFKNKICHVNVHLTPMKVIEKIQLDLYIH